MCVAVCAPLYRQTEADDCVVPHRPNFSAVGTSSDGLSAGAIVGIVVGIISGIAIVLASVGATLQSRQLKLFCV